MEVVNFKSELRKEVKEKRKEIANKKELDERIKSNLLKNKYINECENILIYLSKKDEVDTFNIIKELLKLGKNVYVPKILGKEMKFYKLTDLSILKLGKFNVYEPISNIEFIYNKSSCIIVPGLLFDKNSNRLGYGGGYYDKFLSDLDIYKIGICYNNFLVDNINSEKHYIKMDLVLTEI